MAEIPLIPVAQLTELWYQLTNPVLLYLLFAAAVIRFSQFILFRNEEPAE